MGRVTYDVPVIVQLANPICWVACMAMVASERKSVSIGVGAFANGFDPSYSSIPNPAGVDWEKFKRLLAAAGFSTGAMNPSATEIEALLRSNGPFILTHLCAGFPYGPKWASPPPTAVHAVVITGYDSAINGGQCWMNNPWGDKDQPITAAAVITAINAWLPTLQPQIAYWDPR